MGFVTGKTEWPREDSKPFVNDSRFTKQVRIKRIGRGFYIGSHAVQMGETVVTDAGTAADLCFLKKAEPVEG